MKWHGCIFSSLVVAVLSSTLLVAEQHKPSPPDQEEIWQGEPPNAIRGGGMRYGWRQRNMESMASPGRRPGRGGRGFGGPPEAGRGRQAGGQNRNRIDTEELMAFLEEHEPKVAKKLDRLREENEQKFVKQLPSLRRLYGPIIRMMEENPEMATASLKAIRLRVQVQNTVKKAKDASDDTSKDEVVQELKGELGELFDVILAMEEMRLEGFEDRMEDRPRRKRNRGQGDPNTVASNETRAFHGPQGGPGFRGEGRFRGGRGFGPDGRGRGGGFGGVGRERINKIKRKSMDNKKKNIEIWKKNKDRIIQQRVEELLKGLQPFPWRS